MFLLKISVAAVFAVTLLSCATAGPCKPELERVLNGGYLDESVCKAYCQPGYHGRTCEAKTDEVCEEGQHDCKDTQVCLPANQLGGKSCACITGKCSWGCETSNDDISQKCNPNPCLNGGYCTADLLCKNPECVCKPGYGGVKCEISDPCKTNRCPQSNLAECMESSFNRLGRVCVINLGGGAYETIYE